MGGVIKILIVDDSKPIRSLVEEMLLERSIACESVCNAEEAMDYLRLNSDIDVMLLDWYMPAMSGIELLEKNTNEKFFLGKIIMMTIETKPEKIKEALVLGACEYIMKPFTADILVNKIELANP